jgi:hypothetical protein
LPQPKRYFALITTLPGKCLIGHFDSEFPRVTGEFRFSSDYVEATIVQLNFEVAIEEPFEGLFGHSCSQVGFDYNYRIPQLFRK